MPSVGCIWPFGQIQPQFKWWRPQKKNYRKQTIVGIEKYKEWYFYKLTQKRSIQNMAENKIGPKPPGLPSDIFTLKSLSFITWDHYNQFDRSLTLIASGIF